MKTGEVNDEMVNDEMVDDEMVDCEMVDHITSSISQIGGIKF